MPDTCADAFGRFRAYAHPVLRITDARTGEAAEIRRALTRVHAQVPGDDTSALRVLLVADVLARALELGGSPVLLVADPPAPLRRRADDLGVRPSETAATRGGGRVLRVTGSGESEHAGHGVGAMGADSVGADADITVDVAPVRGTEAAAASSLPVLLGGHSLVSGGLWLLAHHLRARRSATGVSIGAAERPSGRAAERS